MKTNTRHRRDLLLMMISGALLGACAQGGTPVERREKRTACTEEYAPVCDAEGNIYGNTCKAVAAGAHVAPTCHVEHLQTPIETAHPYGNNERRAWTLEAPAEAVKLRVEFQAFHTEQGYDPVRLFDPADGNAPRATYWGDLGTFMSAEVPGRQASIVFNSDGSVTRPGFTVARYAYFTPCICPQVFDPVCGADGVSYGNTCEAACAGKEVLFHTGCEQALLAVPRRVESDHPYANDEDRTWIVAEEASFIRGHFSYVDTESGYDFVEILDAQGQVVARYTGRQDDVTTPLMPGGRFQIRLGSDYSVTAPGFVLDRIEVAGGCYDDRDCDAGHTCEQVQCVRAPCYAVCMQTQEPPPDAGDNEPCGGAADIQCKVGLECVGQDPQDPTSSGMCRKICGPSIPSGFCQAGYHCDITADAGAQDVCDRPDRSGVCLPTPSACPRVDAPVCGCDGVTYTNDCHRQRAGAALDHAGHCADDNACNVPSDCEGSVHIMCVGEWACVQNQCAYHCDEHQYSSQDTPLSIPDGGSVRSAIYAGTVGTIERLTVSVDITHTWRGDLILELSHEGSGTVHVLHAREGGRADDLHLVDVPVTAFNGQVGDGEWTLTVADAATWDTGALQGWSIDIN